MLMNKSRLFKKSIIAATVALASQQALAAGFQLNAQSATGLGRAFAGDAVIADNASVMARNSAAMALFDETSLSLGFESITSKIKVKDAKYTVNVGAGAGTYDSNESDAGATSIAPNIHVIVPIDDKWAVGVNAYSNFGTRTDFSSSFVGSEYGGKTEIVSMNIGTAASYRIDEQWSIGAGLDFIYGKGTLKRDRSVQLGGTNAVDVKDADGWGVGFNVGGVYEMDENNRFGLAYRYSPTIEAKDGSQKIKLPLPDIAEFSGFHKLENTDFAVHYSFQYIGWKAFDKLTLNGNTLKDYNWKNAYHISLGGTYYLNKDWTLRAGYMFDESAQDKTTSFSVPDSDRQWFSAGFTYHLTEKSNVDFGFTYLLGQDVNVSESSNLPNTNIVASTMTGKTHADAILMGLQYSRSF
ncbi:outer membrane protein transport protein [Vibrio sp. SCSIO 43137]|uniref:outer membrane protein transport protein n=1 Tax=Vibrio sp. SCSIO 43137 TaxID=3021011 RepID=UPI002306E9C3|nr:outer membrane protein transport protein [Vibrio sp. SCSIO 43137]WCE31272.1 outer membrane protein transport protein [Vibrio sp. SCSIO 43137]